jgi:lathosterol oxidase
MNFLIQSIAALHDMPITWAFTAAFVGNFLSFAITLGIGHVLVILFKNHPITDPPPPISREEIYLVISCVVLNAVVAMVGIALWRAGVIRVRLETDWGVIPDVLILFFGMDLAMYVFHRVAHLPWLYPIIHATHHRYENPRPLTLFVLNPGETLGFGGLLVVMLCIYSGSALGILIYLTLNLAFGLMGHLGVEPMPEQWPKLPLIGWISTSTFHAEHHQDKGHNYGFYTLIWDRLFGTISPEYIRDFETAAGDQLAVQQQAP